MKIGYALSLALSVGINLLISIMYHMPGAWRTTLYLFVVFTTLMAVMLITFWKGLDSRITIKSTSTGNVLDSLQLISKLQQNKETQIKPVISQDLPNGNSSDKTLDNLGFL